ncbi:hypothetical protein DFJ63DRAFT_312871 [Scheffersomyces coipomensis]|uniref:uncharacterized protein n=1 Tax=Scheffersomyces coipomensis TaxID=1788519 RepID=UPI00315D159C
MATPPTYDSSERSCRDTGIEMQNLSRSGTISKGQQDELSLLLMSIQKTLNSFERLNDEIKNQDRSGKDISKFDFACDQCRSASTSLFILFLGSIVIFSISMKVISINR